MSAIIEKLKTKSDITKAEKELTSNEVKPIKIGNRVIGPNFKPFIIAEIGLSHGGDIKKAVEMIRLAAAQGCECVKFQSHSKDEMVIEEAKKIIPVNAKQSIFDIISECSFSEKQERFLKKTTEENGMLYLSSPYSREAVDHLERLKVKAYKIGSGECNNYPLVEYIAKQKKPVILSTGMNDIKSTKIAVEILKTYHTPFALLQCTSMYPTPYNKVRLYAMKHLQFAFNSVIGLSDHTKDNYCSLGAVALGASIIERHFVGDKSWNVPDVEISMSPNDLKDLILGSNAIFEARNGVKTALQEERDTATYAYASVYVVRPMKKGEFFTNETIWVKKPGTGIHAAEYRGLLGKRCTVDLKANTFLKWDDIEQIEEKEEDEK
jgi:N-acetylneuraminate synthase